MNAVAWTGMAVLALVGLLVGWLLGSRAANAGFERLRAERENLSAERTKFQTQAEDRGRLIEEQKGEIGRLRDETAALCTEKTRADEQLKAAQQSLADERASLARVKEELERTFKSLAGDALKDSNTAFFNLADRQFKAKEQAIDTLLQPVKVTLEKLNEQTQQLEVKREGAYSDVLAQVKNIQQTHEGLRLETNQLVQALRSPKVRGNWGEEQLTRCLGFAGMVEHCDFNTQVYVRNAEDKAQQPDVVVNLPNERTIVIDSKNILYETFYLAINSSDEAEKKMLLQRHATQVRKHLDDLSSKSYWNNFRDSPDFVICFLPSEALFSAALEQDPSLIEYGSNGGVILATPTTLIALLKAVAYGWQQREITRNAIEICKAGDALYRKLAGTQDYFTRLGNALKSSVKQYNDLVGAVEGKDSVFDKASKLHKLGIGQDEIAEAKQIEATVRITRSEHWDEAVELAAAEETSEDRR